MKNAGPQGEAGELQVQIMGKCHFPNIYMN